MAQAVLMDSDIGNHIDDAFALAALCSTPQIHLVGVTTTGQDAGLRAVLARRLLDAYGAGTVPVAAGGAPPARSWPLLGRTLELARSWAHEDGRPVGLTSLELMRRAVCEHPGLTIIATAPLTNIAALLRAYPECAGGIGRIIFMGGWATQALPEYNLRADPDAVAAVLASPIPLTAVGYEATLRCALKGPHVRRLEHCRGEGARLLHVLYEAWREEAPHAAPIMHDPLTVAVLVRPKTVELAPVCVEVVLDAGPGRGTLRRAPDARQLAMCTAVDPAAYLGWLIDAVAPEPDVAESPSVDPSLWHVQVQEAYHVTHYAGWSNAGETGEHHVIVLVTGGEGRLEFDGNVYGLTEGAAAYLPAHAAYALHTASGMRSYWFHFLFRTVGAGAPLTSPVRIPALHVYYPPQPKTPLLRTQAERLLQLWLNPWPEGSLQCQASLLELLALLFHVSQEQEASRASVDDAVVKAWRFIQANARAHLTLDDISRHVGMSKYHLARLFREAYGVPPLEFHRRVRIEHAKRLLGLGTMPVSAVAAQVGYASRQAFTRAFRREVGMAPAEYGE